VSRSKKHEVDQDEMIGFLLYIVTYLEDSTVSDLMLAWRLFYDAVLAP